MVSIGGFVKGAVNTVSGAVKSAGKVAKDVISSKAFNIATTAMIFVPGLNAAGVVGKGLSILGKASTIQKWITSGMKVYSALKNAKGITEAVKSLASGKFQPLGALSNLIGAGGSLAGLTNSLKIINNLQSKFGFLQETTGLLKQAQFLTGNENLAKQMLPAGWSEMTSDIAIGPESDLVQKMQNLQSRVHTTLGMFEELVKLVNPHPLQGMNYLIRA